MSAMVETSLMGAGVVILIVAAGGAFGAMLQAAQLGPAIQGMFVDGSRALGLYASSSSRLQSRSCLKIAQGSSTVAMITAGRNDGGDDQGASRFPFTSSTSVRRSRRGSLVGSWMNDAGFWVFSKIGGVTEVETLKSWTPLSAIVGATSMIVTLVLALVFPLK